MIEKNRAKAELKARRKPSMPKPLRTKTFAEKKRAAERKYKEVRHDEY